MSGPIIRFGLFADSSSLRSYLRGFTERLTLDLGLNEQVEDFNAAVEMVSSGQMSEYTRLLARCYYKLGEWQSALQPDWGSASRASQPSGID